MRRVKGKSGWSQRLVIVSILVIAVCTLFPFSFSFVDAQSAEEALQSFSYRTNPKDVIGNLLLFFPLGFGLAEGLKRQKKYQLFILSIIVCSILSTSVECLQLLLPERTSSPVDVLVNTLGGVLGAFFFRRWGDQILYGVIPSLKKYLSLKSLIIAFIIYTLLALSFSAYGLKKMSITNWKQKFPITLGNEQTGERPWLGSISELWVTDYALKFKETKAILNGQPPSLLQQDHLVALYQLGDQGSREDQSDTLADLIWQGPASDDPEILGAFSRSDAWLQTEKPATPLIRKLKRENQFSLGIKFQTHSLEQDGPARLVSLAKDTSDWNFMLGQDNKSLVFRLHMLFTENGNAVDPQVKFPRVFVDDLPHQIIITYTGDLIQVYVDSVRRRRSFELTPIFVMSKLQDLWFSNIDSSNIRLYRYLYYFTFFAPLSVILGIFTVIGPRNIQTFLLTSIGFIVPPVALQIAFMGNEWQRSNQDNLRLSLLMMVVIITAVNVYSRVRKR